LHNIGLKPEGIIRQLLKEGIQPPKKSKIEYETKKLRQKKTVSSQPTIRDIVNWCEQYKNIPEDENEVFLGNEYESIQDQQIRVFLTTKHLIKYALETKYILSDATYKLTYADYPVLTGGNTDRARAFHPFGLALCSCQRGIDFLSFLRPSKQHVSTFIK
jgi:hypothetical protein